MLYCAVLHCTVLHCTVLYCAYCAVLWVQAKLLARKQQAGRAYSSAPGVQMLVDPSDMLQNEQIFTLWLR